MGLSKMNDWEGREALERLLRIAQHDTGQARRVANFLLAWHNAEENGGWDPVDTWNVDAAIADDMLTVVRLIRESHRYPDGLGFSEEIGSAWRLWRAGKDDRNARSPSANFQSIEDSVDSDRSRTRPICGFQIRH
jgi:hypothetical protein